MTKRKNFYSRNILMNKLEEQRIFAIHFVEKKMRFSVLIPVYNVEKYLNQCIDSVLAQDFKDFEIILVNDGSTDSSARICSEYAMADQRIVYYNKKNEGLLLTRRFSIKRAKGEYCVFLDSDDYWEPHVLKRLDEIIRNKKVDLITYRFHRIRDNGTLIYDDIDIFENETLFDESNKEVFLKKFVSSSRLNLMWIKCVKRSILDIDEDYSGFRDRKGEDLLQSIAIIKNAKTIYYINDPLVFYRLSPTGRGRNFKVKYLEDYEVVRSYVYKNLIDMQVSKAVLNAFHVRYIEGILSYINMIVEMSDNFHQFIETCDTIHDFQTYKMSCENLTDKRNINKKTKGIFCLFNKRRYYIIYSLKILENKIRDIIKG